MSTTPQPGSAASGVLKSVALFGSMSDSEVAILAARTAHRRYAAGELLFTEGEPCSGLYIVAAGRVRIFKTSPAGREQVLAIEGAGSSVAELPVFDGGSYPASASALEPSEILFVSRGDLRATCLEHPEMA